MIIWFLLYCASCVDEFEHFVVKMNKELILSDVKKILKNYGLVPMYQIDELGPYYVVKRDSQKSEYKKRSIIDMIEKATSDPNINWLKKQVWYAREPRGIQDNDDSGGQSLLISDPEFSKQWYLTSLHHQIGSDLIDVKVETPWSRGYDGTGVVIAVLDDGLDYNNKDINDNYDEKASYDFIDYDNDPLPDILNLETSHGTKCAGVIAASNNRFCGVGVAYNASIGGIRMLNLKTTDSIEASALSFQSNYIDIYSCNWGPKDDGTRFGKPGPLTLKALRIGATKGRRSLGSIYVWSSGNGGNRGDDCNADGYVTNIYTIAIGAISSSGTSTNYGETCASVLAVTLSGSSSINSTDHYLVTTDINNKCVDTFFGTSSSASLAAGMIALMLQSNPLLTWRDVQHIIVESALITNPTHQGWSRNGAGKWFNYLYGFGRLDASALVDRSSQWEMVPQQKKCRGKLRTGPWSFNRDSSILLTSNVTTCYENDEIIEKMSIQKLEHFQVVLTITHECRGRLSIEVISPSGTRSILLKPRPNDNSRHGIHEWVFTSVHFWGEDPKGSWTVVVSDLSIFDPCAENKNSHKFEKHIEKGHKEKKNKNKSENTSLPGDSRTTQEDEAEIIENNHEQPLSINNAKIMKKTEPLQPNSTNNSMIERIVVEKYRVVQSEHDNDNSKLSNNFGDIKVIINDPSKNSDNMEKNTLNNGERDQIEDYQSDNDKVLYDEELWRKELDDSELKDTKQIDRTYRSLYRRKRDIENDKKSTTNTKISDNVGLVEMTGIVKLVTLVFYGT